ncbi:ATP-dependent DNA helicase PIF1 [Mycena indigotica]|uniref:ATP-dependent DNA helicase PIF1 n=1 Tax=Mycena indigotica TaxID=2126181 RepID=A0A8H6WCR2_9AGAR|nr:ATP-dependent DNA helicase PIF1 [Mycena indigotica]KAF7310008.1 ATP-dependent DNA helicase PIF1 [Mycena indigotica]
MSVDIPLAVASPSPPVTIMSAPPSSSSNSSVTSLAALTDSVPTADVDPQILEALTGKDRIYVLKLGESMENLINDRTQSRQRIDLTPATTYQRMLVHRCAAYHNLAPETDSLTKVISVVITAESRIPARRIADLSPPPVETPPKFKIMMRKPMSQASSVTGDDGDVSDVEASETGSLGGRSSASASKPRMTMEERTAAYNEARNRIFIDFDEKDQSSASSSASLVSSTSASGDDPGSPATESEWSGPSTKKQPPHRANSASSSRSLRSSAPTFMSANGSSSSRNSRAPSPAFKYPTLYEPPPLNGNMSMAVPPFDGPHQPTPGFHGPPPPQHQQPAMQYYPYPPPIPQGQPQPQQPFMAPYPYYATYGPYSHPPTPGSDPEMYPYNHTPPYWNGPPYHPQQNGGNSPPPQNPQHHMNGSPPPMPPFNNFGSLPNPPPNFAVNGYDPNSSPYGHPQPYYHPNLQQIPMQPYMSPPPHSQPQLPSFEPNRVNGRVTTNGGANGNRRNSNVNGTGKGRPGAPPPQRAAWSYGPGISGGVDFPSTAPVGPRLSGSMGVYGPGMGMRRSSSGNRTTSGSGSSAGDDVSSVASSSTTSSSSRRTYTSTASSTQHHPLPARPDWAVGLRPNPTLHTPRHREHDGRDNSRSTSTSGNSSPHGHGPIRQHQHDLVPSTMTDFPPLSNGQTSISGNGSVQRAPGGAWTNSSSTRSIVMMPGQQAGTGGSNGNALVTHDPKITLARRPMSSSAKDKARGDAVANAILVNQISLLSLEEQDSVGPRSSPSPISMQEAAVSSG